MPNVPVIHPTTRKVFTMTTPDEKYVLTVGEAADYLGCSTDTIRDRIADRTLPAYRLGKGPRGAIRIKRDDLDLLLRRI